MALKNLKAMFLYVKVGKTGKLGKTRKPEKVEKPDKSISFDKTYIP